MYVLLVVQIEDRGENSPLTCLVPDLKEISPDDTFSCVPYEKGHTLLFHLEELAGGPGE
jgi:leukotriene-A4 hydrolase